jgi:hypothetical protein
MGCKHFANRNSFLDNNHIKAKIMTPSNQKLPLVISISLFLAFLASTLLFPSTGAMLGITFLLVSFGMASLIVVKRNRDAYLHGKITRTVFLRNTALEMLGILLAMGLAGLLGRYLSQAVTLPISHTLTRLVTGIIIGVLVGACVGWFGNRTWERLVKA